MGERLGRNTFYNIAGAIVPLIVTIVTLPYYLKAIGEARYGVLALIWLIFGYFGLFDFGLSRATANLLARLRHDTHSERLTVFYTSLLLNTCFGFAAAVAFYLAAPYILALSIGEGSSFGLEVSQATRWIALFFPLAMIANVFVGGMEADERFFTLNATQMLGSVCLQVMPLAAVLLFGPTLEVAVLGILAARLVSISLLCFASIRTMLGAVWPIFSWRHGRSLLRYGGWVTVSNGISPILASIDQFLIAGLLGAGSVTHYSVPFNMAMKVQILPNALARALFPRFSRLGAENAKILAGRSIRTLSAVMAVICAPAILFAHSGLSLWIGPDFAREAATVAQFLLVGTWINGLAYVPLVLLQSQGRPDVVAKLHAAQLVPFVALLWFSVSSFGLRGAAVAWSVRVAIDAALLFLASGFRAVDLKPIAPGGAVVVSACWFANLQSPPILLILGEAAALLSFLAWAVLRDPIITGVMRSKFGNWNRSKTIESPVVASADSARTEN